MPTSIRTEWVAVFASLPAVATTASADIQPGSQHYQKSGAPFVESTIKASPERPRSNVKLRLKHPTIHFATVKCCFPRSHGLHGRTSELDCLTCGACCYQRPGTILVTANDLVRLKRTGRKDILDSLEPGHFGQMAFKMNAAGSCVHHGTTSEPHGCQIYEDRSDTCRDFEMGSWQCLEFRRDKGIDPKPKF
jgi:Fe-S-cluster containining protein